MGLEQMPHLKLELVDRFEDQVLNQAARRCARIAGRNFVPALAGRGHAALRVAASGAPTIARGTPRFPRGEPLQPELVRTPRPARLYVRTYKRAHVHNWQTLIDSANYLRTYVREYDNAHVTTFVRRTYLRAHARTYT